MLIGKCVGDDVFLGGDLFYERHLNRLLGSSALVLALVHRRIRFVGSRRLGFGAI